MVLTQIVAVAAGYYYSVALDENGNIWTWGEGDSGQLGDGGYPDSVPTPTLVTNISNVIAIAAGYEHAVALTASNIVWTWGDNTYGELGDGTTDARAVPEPVFSNVVAIAAGVFFTGGDLIPPVSWEPTGRANSMPLQR
jgi:alpha-tubulin suppressor-like RCC1 family protein